MMNRAHLGAVASVRVIRRLKFGPCMGAKIMINEMTMFERFNRWADRSPGNMALAIYGIPLLAVAIIVLVAEAVLFSLECYSHD
jgi:hypothetical protein